MTKLTYGKGAGTLQLQVGGRPKGTAKTGGRVAGSPKHKWGPDQVQELLERMGCNPLEGMANFAQGNVIALGLMTEDELLAEAEYDPDTGKQTKPSGRERAMELVPPLLRAKMHAELSNYFASRRSAVTVSNPDGSNVTNTSVQFYLPDNGRGK